MINRNFKNIISTALIAAMCTAGASASSTDTKILMNEKMKEVQTQIGIKNGSHIIAEKARELDISETDEIVALAKQSWATAQSKYLVLLEEYNTLAKQYQDEFKKEEAERKRIEEQRKEEERQRQAAKGRYLGRFRITAYTPSPSENGGYSVTATGRRLAGNEWAICAVDPRVIPLGSTIYIEGVGNVVACDTGGAIKGNRIDLLVNYGEANTWGVRYRDVYIK